MTGRARVHARGRRRDTPPSEPAQPEAARGHPMPPVPRTDPPLSFADLVRRGTAAQQPRQIQPRLQSLTGVRHVAEAGPPAGAEATSQPSEELKPASESQESLLRKKRDVGRDYRDFVVNTRQNLVHVRESTKGTQGSPVMLFSNHVRLKSCSQRHLYKYNVIYTPDIEDGRKREALLSELEKLLGNRCIYDGNSLLLPHSLGETKKEVVSKLKNEPVKITFELSRELQTTSPDCLRYYNILFRKMLEKMDLNQIGRNYYNKNKKTEFNEYRLEIWPGYVTSILPYETGLTLCADVSHKLLRMETAYDLISHTREKARGEDAKEKILRKLVGSSVLTKYNNRTYRVDDIIWEMSPSSTFTKSDGSEISFVDYYKERYGTVVTTLNQPLLITKGKWKKSRQDTPHQPIMLVPELCHLTGLTDDMRKDYRMMRDLSTHTRMDPDRRQHKLLTFMDALRKNNTVQKELRDWNLELEEGFLSFSGRTLQDVRIHQGRRMVRFDNHKADWSKNTREAPLLRAMSLDHWLIVYTKGNYETALTLQQNLQRVTPKMGITVRNAKLLEAADTVQSYIRTLEKHASQKTQMVLCLLPTDNKEIYDGIKRYLCINYPIPSQCVLKRTLDRPKTPVTIATKIALQMNCKLGGALWKVDIGLQNAMFIGIDCFHDIERRRKSVAGFVASIDPDLTRWFSQCIIQESGQELVKGLTTCLYTALKLWSEQNSSPPRSIIVYRDGVGDGQLQALIDQEVKQMESYLENSYRGQKVRLTFIVVKKRINTRFFIEKDGGRLNNPSPGTVIDLKVTRTEWYDFFIVSQSVREGTGTVTPTHYNVIHDTLYLSPDAVQGLTYRLCHMYYNFSGIIRVPAPCHYAHKLAYLVGQSLHQQPHESLSKSLFYL
ncbi:piwi-like protein 3 [Bos taurus]|uniref:PIWIL3 n=1 Tax=Bos taurus TaxID=9913 RepID=E1B838_BOVIN|nr:piwi-like protein 3 [Bos taurus]XP_019832692.1 PREDICTED: piwi-like protein 3 [Bos indicus]ALJ77990.1 PIWIL3 [Bos taurus]